MNQFITIGNEMSSEQILPFSPRKVFVYIFMKDCIGESDSSIRQKGKNIKQEKIISLYKMYYLSFFEKIA
jgi:hypothetical protein